MISTAPLERLLEDVYFTVEGKCELAMKNLYQKKQLACFAVMKNLPRMQLKILQQLLISEYITKLW